jgi:hypothetical protein
MESHVSIGEWFKELQHYGYQRFSTMKAAENNDILLLRGA